MNWFSVLDDLEHKYGSLTTWRFQEAEDAATLWTTFIFQNEDVTLLCKPSKSLYIGSYVLKLFKGGKQVASRNLVVTRPGEDYRLYSRIRDAASSFTMKKQIVGEREEEDQIRRRLGIPPAFQYDLFYDSEVA